MAFLPFRGNTVEWSAHQPVVTFTHGFAVLFFSLSFFSPAFSPIPLPFPSVSSSFADSQRRKRCFPTLPLEHPWFFALFQAGSRGWTPRHKSFPFYLVVFRIFLGVTSPIPYIVTRLFSNIIIIYLTIRIYNRKHGFVFLNQFSFTYIYVCIKYPRERTTFSPNPVPSPHEDASHSERDRGGILIPRKFGSPVSCT